MLLESGASTGRSIEEYRKRRFDRAIARLDADWSEEDHPRDENGQFTSGGGTSSGSAEKFEKKFDTTPHIGTKRELLDIGAYARDKGVIVRVYPEGTDDYIEFNGDRYAVYSKDGSSVGGLEQVIDSFVGKKVTVVAPQGMNPHLAASTDSPFNEDAYSAHRKSQAEEVPHDDYTVVERSDFAVNNGTERFTQAQKDAARVWSSNDFVEISSMLRNGTENPDFADTVDELTTALEGSKFDRDMRLMRECGDARDAFAGVKFPSYDEMFGVGEEAQKKKAEELDRLLTGAVGIDESFMACDTCTHDKAGLFVMRIYAPKGTEGAFIGRESEYRKDSENETLLQRGTMYRCTGVKRNPRGGYLIDVEIIGQRPRSRTGNGFTGPRRKKSQRQDSIDRFRARRTKRLAARNDGKEWKTTEKGGKHYQIETETGEVIKGNIGTGSVRRETRESIEERIKKNRKDNIQLRERGGVCPFVVERAYKKLDLNLLGSAVDTVIDVAKDFPILAAPVNIDAGETEFAGAVKSGGLSSYTITLSERDYSDPKNLESRGKDPKPFREGLNPEQKTRAMVAHEMAHCVETAIAREDAKKIYPKLHPDDPRWKMEEYAVRNANAGVVAAYIVRGACKEVYDDYVPTPSSMYDLTTIAEKLGHYAVSSFQETMAEAFADYYANGDESAPISKAIVEHTKSYIKELGISRFDAADDGIWRTTENGHKIHINGEGDVDKGNPHVVDKMESTDYDTAVNRYKKKEAELRSEYESKTKGMDGEISKQKKEAKKLENDAIDAREALTRHRIQYGNMKSGLTAEVKEERERLESDAKAKTQASYEAWLKTNELSQKKDKEKKAYEQALHDSDEGRAYRSAVLSKYPTYDDCDTSDAVEERLRAADHLDIGSELVGFDKVDIKSARMVAKGIDDFCEKCPFVSKKINKVEFGGLDAPNAIAEANLSVLRLDPSFFGDMDKAAKYYNSEVEKGFHPQGTTVDSVVYHELTHVLEKNAFVSPLEEHLSTTVIKRVSDSMGISMTECAERVSLYAKKTYNDGRERHAEFLAEAYSEYLTSPHPRAVAVEVGKEVEKELKARGLMQ